MSRTWLGKERRSENASVAHRALGGSGQGQWMPLLVLVSGPELQGTNALCHPWLGRKGSLGGRTYRPEDALDNIASSFLSEQDPGRRVALPSLQRPPAPGHHPGSSEPPGRRCEG